MSSSFDFIKQVFVWRQMHGSIERISCVTQHTDYAAMTNREVLKQVVLLLRDKSGRTCHRHGNQTEKFSQTLIVSYKAIVLLPHFS